MKKLLVTTLLAGAFISSALAQGTVTVNANAGKIIYSLDGSSFTAVPSTDSVPGYGIINVALYVNSTVGAPLTFNPNGTVGAGWVIQTTAPLQNIAPVAGALPSTVVTLPNGYLGGVQAALLGWTGAYSSYDAAILAGTSLVGYAGSAISITGSGVNGSSSWAQATGNPGGTPPTSAVAIITGSAGFNGLVVSAVPEPSSFALAGLGLAALTIFRRRK